jgi:tetratricopeptide (TPR) repeat protein
MRSPRAAAMIALASATGHARTLPASRTGAGEMMPCSMHFLMLLQLTGDYPAAAQALEEALGIYADIGDRGGEALALNDRGTLYRLTGERALAEGCHQRSLEIFQRIGAAEAAELSAELAALTEPGPAR